MIRPFRFLAAVLALGVVTADAAARQTGSIAGVVTDQATQQPLSGVQVHVPGTALNAFSGPQGRFTIANVPAGEHTVRATYIGYAQAEQPVTVALGEATTLNFELRVMAIDLDAVVVSVVTGRAERKRELGTNSASISAAEIDRAPITKMADVLVGRAAGVQMQGVSGSVGTSQRIRIRGANSISLSNEPLIFVDGIQFSNNKGGIAMGGADYSRLNDLNPEDISNIEILKGPAASALYGTAAANGVLLITTRRGTAGTARWRGYAEYGTSEDRNTYPLNFMTAQANDPSQDMFRPTGTLNRVANDPAASAYVFCPNESAARGVCRQDETLALNPFDTQALTPFQTGNRQKYGLSVSGGTDAVTYYVSGDYDTEEGVIYFNTQDRASARTNVDARVRDNLGIGVNASYTRTSLQLNSNDNSIFSPLINGLLASPMVPTNAAKEASSPGSRPGTGFGYSLSDIEENIANQLVDRFLIGSNANWQPISYLTFNANAGLDYFGRFDNNTVQPGRLPIAATWTPGRRNAVRVSNYIWTANTSGTATFELSPTIGSTTTLGGGFTRELLQSTRCQGYGILETTRSCTAVANPELIEELYTEVRTVGGYFQQMFSWRDRVFLAGSLRGDDNSAFGTDFGFIYYPGASASWMISEEPFFPATDVLSSLRLRTAVGTSGQRPNFRDAHTLLGPVSATVGNSELAAVRLSRVGNPDLKPERTTEFEVGFDAGLISDRVSLEFGYFTKESRDALVAKPLPGSHGLTGDDANTGVIWDNLGSIRNWGTELALNARVIQTPQALLNVRLSAMTLDNRIEDLGKDIAPITLNRNSVQMHKQGFPTGAFHGRRFEIRNPNEQRLLTRDDVILVDVDSSVFLGRSLPTNSQAISGDLTLFRNLLTISTLFERRGGLYQLNDSERFRCFTGYSRGDAGASQGMGQCTGVADPNAPLWEQARFIAQRFGAVDPTSDPSNPRRVTTVTGYIEKADFIKLRELSLTLNVPEQLARSAQLLRGASITLSGRNLATWTDYTGLDPEINEGGGDSNFNQGEFNTQPPLRYFTFRVNYTF